MATASLAAGPHTLAASLTADPNYSSATAASTLTVSPTSLALAVAPISIPYGTASTALTARITYPGIVPPSGALLFSLDSGSPLPATCTGTTSPLSCTATVATASLAAGPHTLAASLAADPNYSSATAASALTVSPTSLALVVAPVSIPYGTASTALTAHITYPGTVAPSGALVFILDGGTPLPATCTGTTSPQSCTATVATASLAAGAHTLAASLAADPNYRQRHCGLRPDCQSHWPGSGGEPG